MQLLSTARQMPGKKNQEMKRQTESSMVVARKWGEEEMMSYCLMVTEFQLEKVKRF